ncbi:hypothetical protein CDAR_495211 [Caerostris darwini]|uniref:Uncharacterized protein n=1 Tax=Caerostris darwini TaxID=1538125 RepID=A0AAV4UYG3_9ARAC|nr:hypothetical protein CDAR_495211 [Caerostris darwini]
MISAKGIIGCDRDTVQALAGFEASLDSSFSPICHRTRQQTRERLISSPSVDSRVDSDILETVCELIDEVSCVTPMTIARGVVQVLSPSTIIDIEDVPSAFSSPLNFMIVQGLLVLNCVLPLLLTKSRFSLLTWRLLLC